LNFKTFLIWTFKSIYQVSSSKRILLFLGLRDYVPGNHLFLRLFHQHSNNHLQHSGVDRVAKRAFRSAQNQEQNAALNHSDPHNLLLVYSYTAAVFSAFIYQSSVRGSSCGTVVSVLVTFITFSNVYGSF